MGSTLILSTIGAKTGRRRQAHLTAFPEAGGWLVVASRGGDAHHPGWLLNLAAHPDEVWVQVGMSQMQVRVEILKGAERAAAWARVVNTYSVYDSYAKKTDRQIPIVRLRAIEVVPLAQLVMAAGV
jgi:deazaflavin-dependent oxidoreductase (nitroreductase family)